MALEYINDIFDLLQKYPDGLSVKKISRYIYNQHNGFFNPVSYDDIYSYINDYLTKAVKRRNSFIERCGRSIYRLTEYYHQQHKFSLDFTDEADSEHKSSSISKDVNQLSLFDDI